MIGSLAVTTGILFWIILNLSLNNFFSWILLAINVQIFLLAVHSFVDRDRLVIDEEGIHLFMGDLLRESIRWDQIKRIETGWFSSFAIWKDSKVITFEPTHFSRSDLKRAYEVILSRLAEFKKQSRVRKVRERQGVRSGNSR